MMWCSEVEDSAGALFDVAVAVEFGAVIGGDGFDFSNLAVNQLDDSAIEFGGCKRATPNGLMGPWCTG